MPPSRGAEGNEPLKASPAGKRQRWACHQGGDQEPRPLAPALCCLNRRFETRPFWRGEGGVIGEWFWICYSCLCVHVTPPPPTYPREHLQLWEASGLEGHAHPATGCQTGWSRTPPRLPSRSRVPVSHSFDLAIPPNQPQQLWPTRVRYFFSGSVKRI